MSGSKGLVVLWRLVLLLAIMVTVSMMASCTTENFDPDREYHSSEMIKKAEFDPLRSGLAEPQYPPGLNLGVVRVQGVFVVDAMGLVDTSKVKFHNAVPPLVEQAVKVYLAQAIYTPAEDRLDRKVKQLVPFDMDVRPYEVRYCARGDPCMKNVPYFEWEVDVPVGGLPLEPLRYPEAFVQRDLGHGEVLAQFVVDTTGRVEMGSFKVLKTTHQVFTSAVRSALVDMQFVPAVHAGRRVRQLVQTPILFE